MILKLIIKKHAKFTEIQAWIQNLKNFNEDLNQIFSFFKESIKVSKKRRIRKFYKVTSEQPAIILSLVSTIHEIIPELFFNNSESLENEEIVKIENSKITT